MVAQGARDTPHAADPVPGRVGSPPPLIPPAWHSPAQLWGMGGTARATCNELPISSCSLTPTFTAFTVENFSFALRPLRTLNTFQGFRLSSFARCPEGQSH